MGNRTNVRIERHWNIIESHVDWITATAGHDTGAVDLLNVGLSTVARMAAIGGKVERTSLLGYEGSSANGAFAGWRADGSCVRLSGPTARDHWLTILPHANRVTRIDLCVTAQSTPPTESLAVERYEARAVPRTVRGAAPDNTLIQSRGHGSTFYVGSRSSARFGRLYDKSKQSPGEYPDGCWRWEVEYKAEAAQPVADALKCSSGMEITVAAAVAQRYDEWGHPVPWTKPDEEWRDTIRWHKTDDERRLLWLQNSVAGTIEDLATRVSRRDILVALGLWHNRLDGSPVGTDLKQPGEVQWQLAKSGALQ